jgi:hypothetical protein
MIRTAILCLACWVLAGCCGFPLNPPVLRLTPEGAQVYDILTETNDSCL